MVGSNEIELRENGRALYARRKVMDVWDWIPLRDRPIVQCMIVSTGSPITGGGGGGLCEGERTRGWRTGKQC